MDLRKLASKPQLVKLSLDSEEIVSEYGEALEFYVYDRLPMDTYGRLASLDNTDASVMYNTVKDLILDESGAPVISGDLTLPMNVMNAALTKVVEHLGK